MMINNRVLLCFSIPKLCGKIRKEIFVEWIFLRTLSHSFFCTLPTTWIRAKLLLHVHFSSSEKLMKKSLSNWWVTFCWGVWGGNKKYYEFLFVEEYLKTDRNLYEEKRSEWTFQWPVPIFRTFSEVKSLNNFPS